MEQYDKVYKACAFCGEQISAADSRCKYCGSLLNTAVDENNRIVDGNASYHNYVPQAVRQPYYEQQPVSQHNNAQQPGNSIYGRYSPTNPLQASIQTNKLSNGIKVLLTVLFTIIPGIGQLAGIITAIIFMNYDDDADRRSFGVALLVASIVMFVISCLFLLSAILLIALSEQSVVY